MRPDLAEDEIDLWAYVAILARGRWLIAAITAAAVGAAAFVSFFLMDPVYEARATLVVTQPPQASAAPVPGLEKLSEVITALAQIPTVSLEAVESQLVSPALLARVAARLDLDGPPESLAGRVSVSRVRGANTLEVAVSDSDPEAAAQFVNALTQTYLDLYNELAQARFLHAAAILDAEISKQTAELERVRGELSTFLREGEGLDELRGEFAEKVGLLTQYRTRLVALEVERAAAAAELASLEKDLAGQPPILTVRRALVDDPLLSAAETDETGQQSVEGAARTITSEEINPVYTELAQRSSLVRSALRRLEGERSATIAATTVLTGEVERLRLILAEREAGYEALQQAVDLHRGIVETLTSRYAEVRIAATAATSPIAIIPAVVPRAPAGPRKLLNVTVAGVLGLMAGVLLVFLRAGWQTARAHVLAAEPPYSSSTKAHSPPTLRGAEKYTGGS